MHCSFSYNRWLLAGFQVSPLSLAPFFYLMAWLPNHEDLLSKIFTLCHQLWRARNKHIFHNIPSQPVNIVHAAAKCFHLYHHHCNIKWHPPTPPYLKLNFDGCVHPNHKAAGFVRNSTGHPLLAMEKRIVLWKSLLLKWWLFVMVSLLFLILGCRIW